MSKYFEKALKKSAVLSATFAFFRHFFLFSRRPQNTSMWRNNKMSQCSVGAELRLFDEDRPRKDLKFKSQQYFKHSLTFNSSEETRNAFSKKPI